MPIRRKRIWPEPQNQNVDRRVNHLPPRRPLLDVGLEFGKDRSELRDLAAQHGVEVGRAGAHRFSRQIGKAFGQFRLAQCGRDFLLQAVNDFTRRSTF